MRVVAYSYVGEPPLNGRQSQLRRSKYAIYPAHSIGIPARKCPKH
jgi:hypothetical protein